MKRKYSTWYMSGSDTKIKKKKNTYLCKDKIPLDMVLGCVCTHTYSGHMFTLI